MTNCSLIKALTVTCHCSSQPPPCSAIKTPHQLLLSRPSFLAFCSPKPIPTNTQRQHHHETNASAYASIKLTSWGQRNCHNWCMMLHWSDNTCDLPFQPGHWQLSEPSAALCQQTVWILISMLTTDTDQWFEMNSPAEIWTKSIPTADWSVFSDLPLTPFTNNNLSKIGNTM